MSYDEEQQRKSRVVVETPHSRREVVQSETSYAPNRSGISTGTVAALVIGALALATLAFLFLRSNHTDNANANSTTTTTTTTAATTAPTAPPPTIIQQAAPPQQQPPVIIQAPPAAQAPAQPLFVPPPNPSAPAAQTGSARSSSSSTATDDATVQANVSKKIADASDLSTSNITATVSGGTATISGTVNTNDLKNRAERLVRTVRGVRSVDNQIVVSDNGNDSLTPEL